MNGMRCLTLAAVVLLGACDNPTPASSGRTATELERDLDATRAALDTAERTADALRAERERDRDRVAGLAAQLERLEHRNRELAEGARINEMLRRQREGDRNRIRALTADAQSLRAALGRAHGEIRRLQTGQPVDPRRAADERQRQAALARELQELRRYNGFLLQERGNLQAWLHEASAARQKQEDLRQRAEQEAEQLRLTRADADTAIADLRRSLDDERQEMRALAASRDGLETELESLRADAQQRAAAERHRAEALSKALARADAPAAPLASAPRSESAVDRGPDDADKLRADLEAAGAKIARLSAARDYLVEKIEACTSEKQAQVLALDRIVRLVRLERAAGNQRGAGPWMSGTGRNLAAQWRPGLWTDSGGPPRLVPVADETTETAKSTRRDKELNETRQKLADLEQRHGELKANLAEVEAQLAAVKKQVETLTWANKELVKELDAAYATSKAGETVSLPQGVRGLYVVRKGQSLSEVAKAFYGDAGRWRDIVAANEKAIPDPDRIAAGTVIVIPD